MDGVLKEPTIWRVKCMAGRERQMAFCLCKTFVDFQEFGTNLAIISAFALDHACRVPCDALSIYPLYYVVWGNIGHAEDFATFMQAELVLLLHLKFLACYPVVQIIKAI